MWRTPMPPRSPGVDRSMGKEDVMTTIHVPLRISIAAPTASAAFLLEKRLAHLHPSAIAHGSHWAVHLEDAEDRLDEIEAVVGHWLRELGVASTRLEVDGRVRTLTAPAPREEDALGPDYETDPVLEHEP